MAEAASVLNVSTRSVERAKAVLDKGSKQLVEAVENGSVPVTLAEKLVRECDDKKTQTELAKQGKKAIREFLTPPSDVVEEVDDTLHDEAREFFDRYDKSARKAIMALWRTWLAT